MRLLRWAVELTADSRRPALGVLALRALSSSPLLQAPDRASVGAVLREAAEASPDVDT